MRAGKIAQVPGSMGSPPRASRWQVDPALEGRWKVTLADGRDGRGHDRLRAAEGGAGRPYPLDAWRRGALRLAAGGSARVRPRIRTRKPAMIIHGAGTNHWFHNDLLNRAMILLVALTGNVGKNGGGFNHYVGQERIWPEHGFKHARLSRGREEAALPEHDAVDLLPLAAAATRTCTGGKPIEHYIARVGQERLDAALAEERLGDADAERCTTCRASRAR